MQEQYSESLEQLLVKTKDKMSSPTNVQQTGPTPSSTTNANGGTTSAGTPFTNIAALRNLIPTYSGSENITEIDILEFLASVKKVVKLFDWDSQRHILAIELSLTGDAKNFWNAQKQPNQLPEEVNDLENKLINRFYQLKTEVDRQRLMEALKMKTGAA